MSNIIYDAYNRPTNKKANEIRKDFQHIKPKTFQILSINDDASVRTNLIVAVFYQKDNLEKTTEIKAELVHLDEQNNPTLRGELNGKWNIYERSFNPIIYPKMA